MGDIKSKHPKETLPKPDGLHHIIEDFTTVFDGPTMHMLPLRRWWEFFSEIDLRTFTAESCIGYDMLYDLSGTDGKPVMPPFCDEYFVRDESVFSWIPIAA